MNRSADELERAAVRVSRWVLGLVALFYGFRFAMDWYSGPSVAWGFGVTALAAIVIWIVLWRWGEQLALFYEWLWSLLPWWMRGGD